jgi:hypothetical protein
MQVVGGLKEALNREKGNPLTLVMGRKSNRSIRYIFQARAAKAQARRHKNGTQSKDCCDVIGRQMAVK